MFSRTRDEAAFAELARRHGGLIYHTALRRTGSPALAEEVSQQVLCVLVRKAAQLVTVLDQGALPRWLHRATTLEASKALRDECSHQRRSQLLHPDDQPATGTGGSPWEDMLPHLDPALDRLGEGDRNVVILHFFERLTFREIAAITGRSAAAVQRQSSRAVEKLSRLLRTRGVVLPMAVLASGLAAESAKAAPAILLSTLATKAFATAAILPAKPLIAVASTKPKVLVPLAAIVCLLPFVIRQSILSHEERDATARTSDLHDLPPAGRGALPPPQVHALRPLTAFGMRLEKAGFRIDGREDRHPDHALVTAARESKEVTISFAPEAPMEVVNEVLDVLKERQLRNIRFDGH